MLSGWDDYASELLINGVSSFEPIEHNGELIGFQIPEYDYKKLKLFFLSVLWRASVSTQPFFEKVSLGPHEAFIRDALLRGDPQDTDWFSVSLAKWSDHPVGAGMMNPYRTRFSGLNYYVMYLEKYIVYYKVDTRISNGFFRSIQLNDRSPLIAVSRELSSSRELQIMAGLVRNG